MEERKLKEIEWAEKKRTVNPETDTGRRYLANMKYYSVVRKTKNLVGDWIRQHCKDRDTFEMACGNGGYSVQLAQVARSVTAADISPVSIQQARERAKADPLQQRIKYVVLDCENTGLPDNTFDVICEGGALHHMDIHSAFNEAARLLRPNGKFLCVEALRHNPVIQLYRKLTPHLRTAWEADHILGRSEIMVGASHFQNCEIHLLHITTVLATPLRGTFLFDPVLSLFETIDECLVRIPGFRWMAWQAVFILSDPIKEKAGKTQPALEQAIR